MSLMQLHNNANGRSTSWETGVSFEASVKLAVGWVNAVAEIRWKDEFEANGIIGVGIISAVANLGTVRMPTESNDNAFISNAISDVEAVVIG